MHILLLLPKVQTVLNFKKSFLEGFCALGIKAICYEVDGERSFDIQREEVFQCIRNNRITDCLMINDISHHNEFFINEDILKAVNCYVWFVDAAYCNIKDPNLKLYKGVYSFEPKDIEYGLKTYGLKFTYLPLTAGQSTFCNCNQKKRIYIRH